MQHNPSPQNRLTTLAPAAACLLLAALAAYLHGNEDLWNDEIYTLQFFVFKGFSTIVTDYHVPNNHILANILHWAWTGLFGLNEGDLLDTAWKIRLLPGLLSAGTALVLWRTGRRFWGSTGAWVAVLLLLSGITFQCFAFGVRGYPLSLLIASGLLYSALLFLEKNRLSLPHAIGMAAGTAALLYTIPSNLYFIAALGVMAALAKGWKSRDQRLAIVQLELALLAGIALAVGLYAPVLGKVLHNEYVEAGAAMRAEHWQNAGRVLTQFFSWRFLLLPLLLFGWWKAGSIDPLRRKQVIFLAGVLLLPFLFSALRGDNAPMRTYLIGLPAFVLLCTAGWISALERPAVPAAVRRWGMMLAGVYCLAAYVYSIQEARQKLEKGLVELRRDQELNYNYYEDFYAPNREFDQFHRQFPNQTLILETTEPFDLPVYLAHKQQRFVPLDSIQDYIMRERTIYVSTRYPRNFIREMEKLQPAWGCSYLQGEVRYPRVVVCKRR